MLVTIYIPRIADAGTWEPRRVSYPIEITQERMRARNMPRRLIRRLESGR